MGDGSEILATALLLLLCSPLLGLGTMLALHKVPLPSLRQVLLTNLLLTAITATAIPVLADYVAAHSNTEWRGTTLRITAWTIPGHQPDARPWWPVMLSVTVDALNRGPLCWLAWGAFAAGLLTQGHAPESAGRYGLLLFLEAAWLWTYAAGDGTVFLGGLVLSGLAMAMLTAWWGREERRVVAARLCRWWLIADGLLLLGLIGLANAAVWSQQHLTETLPSLSMTWETLAQKLPRMAMHNQSAAQYWAASAGWWLWPLVIGAAIRSGVPPFHSATVQWWGQAATPVSVLTVIGGMPVGWFVWMRVIAPTFAAELKEQSALFAGWGALAVLGAGMLCLAQSEPKKCAAWFTLAGGGLAWFLMSSGSNSAWDAAVVFTWGGTALLALVSVMDERQPITRAGGWNGLWQSAPRWSAALVVTIGSLVGFPAAARWPLDWQLAWQLAGARPGPFFVAMTGWFITGWAVVWMMQRWLWGTTASAEITSNTVLDSVDDLRRSETAAMAVLLIVMALVASGWWTAEMVTPATPTGESRAALGAGLP